MKLDDLLWIFVSAFVGVAFHVFRKIGQIQQRNLEIAPWDVVKIYFREDWYTLCQSALAIIFGLLAYRVAIRLLAAGQYTSTIIMLMQWIELVFAGIGFMGQAWIYKLYGTADKKVSELLKSPQDPTA